MRKPAVFRAATATAAEIFAHLTHCNGLREALLDRGVDIRSYAEKLAARATTFEAWQDEALVGLVAAYINDTNGRIGYISNVSVLDNARGQGIASALLRMCLDKAIEGNFGVMMLEASRRDPAAIALYRKFGFQAVDVDGDILPMRRLL